MALPPAPASIHPFSRMQGCSGIRSIHYDVTVPGKVSSYCGVAAGGCRILWDEAMAAILMDRDSDSLWSLERNSLEWCEKCSVRMVDTSDEGL
jgi:hypothetical protein